MSGRSEGGAGPVAEEEDRAARRGERAILLVLATVQFTSIVDFMLVMPLGPQLMRTLGIDPQRFGLIVSSYTLSAGVAGLLAAPVVDRFGRKAALLVLYVGFLIGTLFCGLTSSFPMLLLARVVTGAFGGILGGMALTIIGDVFPDRRRGAATGALMSAFSVASVVGVPFGLELGTRYGWQMPFRLLAVLGAAVLVFGLRALPPLRGHLDTKPITGRALARTWEALAHPNHVRAFALVVALMLGGFAVIPYISAYLVANAGVAEAELSWVYIAGGVTTLVSSPIIGRLVDRFGKLRVFWIVAPFSAVMMFAVTVLPRVGIATAAVTVALIMLGNSGRMIAAMPLIMASVEPRLRGSFMSVYSSVQHIASGLGAYLGGLILVEAADGSLRHFPRVGAIAVAATVASLYLAGRLRPAATAGPDVSADADRPLGHAIEAAATRAIEPY